GILFAAFAPLAEVTGSGKLSALYDSDQNLGSYINSMFKVAISAGAIIAVIRLGVAGFKYMGSDMWSTKSKAREDIGEVFLGLLLLLSLWIILNQINPNLLNLNIVFPKTQGIAAPAPILTRPSSIDQGVLDGILADENRVRGILNSSGIGINARPCSSITDSGCTNVGQLGTAAITGLQVLKANCRCSVTVTGGTEGWLHSKGTAHGPNNPIVDLRKDARLDNYIRTAGLSAGSKNGRPQYRLGGGTFWDEDNLHWHVAFF
ncbi:MAG: hypothetical protein NUV88_03000, partial [Candidatus Kaiserbacteria bacterium]|nr:hypothetical protein [Candidatus Kaiserbacteria bacterium]